MEIKYRDIRKAQLLNVLENRSPFNVSKGFELGYIDNKEFVNFKGSKYGIYSRDTKEKGILAYVYDEIIFDKHGVVSLEQFASLEKEFLGKTQNHGYKKPNEDTNKIR